MKTFALFLAACALVACTDGASPAPAAPPAAQTPPSAAEGHLPPDPGAGTAATSPADAANGEAAYLGRWIGVEGMFLEVTSKAGGGVSMQMQWDLDHAGTFDGSVTAEGLRFMREGVAETAVRTDGDATGLKHLAGKADCLTVKSGEGYCRD